MNASRGTARNASRMSGSVIPRRRSCRSTIASRLDAKSVMGLTLDQNQRRKGSVPMASIDVRFSGSVPVNYERYMVPLLFRPYAELLANRAARFAPRSILETAAGTGVVTDALARALPDAEIVATDLNQAMLDVAAARVNAPNVTFRQADALELPFEDA